MEQKEKLRELIERYDDERCNICGKHGISCENYECPPLIDYLINNGVIVLPCKVGDLVYQIDCDRIIVERKVMHFIVQNDCIRFAFYIPDFGGYITAKGEKIFLTREEAEAALKGEK